MDCETFDYLLAPNQVRGYSSLLQKYTMEHFVKIISNVNLKMLAILTNGLLFKIDLKI